MIKAGIVMDDNMSNLTSASNDASISSGNINEIGSVYPQQPLPSSPTNQSQLAAKKKRNLPGNPDPEAEVIAMSPRTLLATNRFICEICNKGFQREQNLQLHRRGHNLPWKLKQRTDKEVIRKKVYVCPETTCVHHDPSRALGDLTGIKKHFSRKHGEKKWKCEKCSKRYAVQTDWKAHSKICGTREYRCDCGTLFSRRDSFITHRAFCDVLAEESARSFTSNPLLSSQSANQLNLQSEFHGGHGLPIFPFKREQDLQQSLINLRPEMPPWLVETGHNPGTGHHDLFSSSPRLDQSMIQHENHNSNPNITLSSFAESPHMSATALLQKAAQMGVTMSSQPCQSVAEMTTTLRPHKAHMRTTAAAATGIAGIMSSTSLATSTAGSNLGLSSREEMRTEPTFIHHGSAYFGNITSGCMEQVGATDDHHGTFMGMMSSLPPSTSDNHGIQGAPFGENFHGILNSKRDNEINFQERNQKPDGSKDGGVVGSLGGNVGLTRDFLGLKAFPHREFLNLDDLHQIGGSSYDHQHQQNQNPAPWQS